MGKTSIFIIGLAFGLLAAVLVIKIWRNTAPYQMEAISMGGVPQVFVMDSRSGETKLVYGLHVRRIGHQLGRSFSDMGRAPEWMDEAQETEKREIEEKPAIKSTGQGRGSAAEFLKSVKGFTPISEK